MISSLGFLKMLRRTRGSESKAESNDVAHLDVRGASTHQSVSASPVKESKSFKKTTLQFLAYQFSGSIGT